VRIENVLPQTFRLALIRRGARQPVSILTLGVDNAFTLPLALNQETNTAVLVVSGTTRFTHQAAVYRYRISDSEK